MTAQNTRRKAASGWLATVTAALVALSGLALAPTAASAADPATPKIELSTNLLDPAGDTLTVTGTGFDAGYVGLPVVYGCANGATAPKGVYVQVGWIKDTWRPSQGGANNTDRKGNISGLNTWFADQDLNCRAPGKWTIAADGTASFTQTFTVTQAAIGALPEGARYAVFTHGGAATSGDLSTQQPDNELSADIHFLPSKANAALPPANGEGLKVDVSAPDVPSGVPGAHGAIIEKGTEASLSDPSADYVAFAYDPTSQTPFPTVADGATSFSLLAPAAKLDPAKEYVVLVWKQHAAATPQNIYARAAITVTDDQWAAVFPATATALKFSNASSAYNAANSATVTVTSPGGTPTGKATVKIAGQSYAVTLVGGKGTIKLAKPVSAGTHTATVNYVNSGSGTLFTASSATAVVRVAKATPKAAFKFADSSITTRQYAKLSVSTSIPGSLKAVASKFTLKVYDGSKLIKTTKLDSRGKITVKIPKLKKGTHKVKVRISSTANTNAAYSAVKTLKVAHS